MAWGKPREGNPENKVPRGRSAEYSELAGIAQR